MVRESTYFSLPIPITSAFLAEEYYKNDYPDEDDDSGEHHFSRVFSSVDHRFLDEFHEDSDYDRIVHYHNSEDDFD